ncbi:hypothetical protein [Gluconobacter frateurii]|uniref:hypothetical protein n=1 Tax=Gluconobacter frateurii TaxID=38308 RepID=UPI0009ED43CF|nr:hypothetical protein [Gluconobacter frateurii]
MSSIDHLTSDSDLHLVLEDGAIIRPARWQGQHALFMLPEVPPRLWILSRLNSGFNRFEERGVLIGDITFYDGFGAHRLTTHLTSSPAEGWGPQGGPLSRWTNGRALLEFDCPPSSTAVMMSMEVCSTGPYRLCPHEASQPPKG